MMPMSRRKFTQLEFPKSTTKRLAQIRLRTSQMRVANLRSSSARASAIRDAGSEVLAILRPHQRWLAYCVIGGIAAACLFLILRQPAYTSSAILQQDLTSVTATTPGVAPALDASSVVRTQMYRLQSAEFARQAVDRMVKDRPPGASLASLYPSIFNGLRDDSNPTDRELDVATKKLLSRLRVWNEARTYINVISYSAGSPEEAARVVNLLVAEHGHTNKIQEIAGQLTAAQNTVTKLAGALGPKHPQMVRAVADLTQAQARMEAATNAPLMQPGQLFETGEVFPARPNNIATGLGKTFVLFSAFVVTLIFTLIALLLIEYRSFEKLAQRYFNWRPKSEPDQSVAA